VSTSRSWAAELLRTGVHEDLSGRMVDSVGLHGPDQADVICDGSGVREHFAEFHAALTGFLECEAWPEAADLGLMKACAGSPAGVPEGEVGRCGREFGLVIEEFQVAGGTCLEHVDDAFGFGWKVGLLGCQRSCWIGCVAATFGLQQT
jgi:hypothetical protein